MKKERRKLICFDMDNTLIYANKSHGLAYVKAFRKNKLPKVKYKSILKLFGLVGSVLVRELYPYLADREVLKIIKDHDEILMKETKKYARPIEGVVKALRELKKNYRLAIVTNSRSNTMLTLLRATRIDKNLFDICIGNEKVIHPKPAPDEILKAEKLLHIKADYMVGDTLYDIIAAKKAHVKAIAVLTGNQSRYILKKYKPHKIIKSVKYLPRVI